MLKSHYWAHTEDLKAFMNGSFGKTGRLTVSGDVRPTDSLVECAECERNRTQRWNEPQRRFWIFYGFICLIRWQCSKMFVYWCRVVFGMHWPLLGNKVVNFYQRLPQTFERHSETELGTVDDINCVRDVRHLLVINRFHTQTKREHGDFLTWHSQNAEKHAGIKQESSIQRQGHFLFESWTAAQWHQQTYWFAEWYIYMIIYVHRCISWKYIQNLGLPKPCKSGCIFYISFKGTLLIFIIATVFRQDPK